MSYYGSGISMSGILGRYPFFGGCRMFLQETQHLEVGMVPQHSTLPMHHPFTSLLGVAAGWCRQSSSCFEFELR